MNDMMMEQLGTSGYRFIRHSNRPISVVFDEVPDRRISTGTRNLTQAIRFAERFIASGRLEELKERVEAAKNPTLAEFAKDFFLRTDADSYRRYSEAHNRISSDNAYQSHQSRLDLYIIPKFGKRRLVDLCARDIDRWLTIEIKGKKVKDLSSNYRRKLLITFRIVLAHAVYLGLIDRNPAQEVRPVIERVKNPRQALTLMEQSILFPYDAAKRIRIWGSTMWALYFSISYDTGFRPGEVAGLSLENVYKTSSGYAVATTQSISGLTHLVQQRVKTTGNGVSERVGLLDGTTAEILGIYLTENRDRIDALKPGEPFLLMDEDKAKHKYIQTTSSNKRFKSVLRAHGLEIKTQYVLRHSYATERRGDISERLLALAMGHSHLRDDYDHQKGAKLISQLEAERETIFRRDRAKEAASIVPLKRLMRGGSLSSHVT